MVGVSNSQAANTKEPFYVQGYPNQENKLPSGAWFALNCQGFLVTGQEAAFAFMTNGGSMLIAGNPAVINGSSPHPGQPSIGNFVVSRSGPLILLKKTQRHGEAYNNTNL
jgi:hypothetical protein